jgi:3-phosphoglycerate kinase
MSKLTLGDLDPGTLAGKVALVRADLNVPLEGGTVADDQRIRASLPTLEFLTRAGARVVLLSHLGRPKGEPKTEFSLSPVAVRLRTLMEGGRVRFVDEAIGPEVRALPSTLRNGEIALLQNTRFLPGETVNDTELAEGWAALGDLFVNDAFGTAHRANASTAGLAEAVRRRGGRAVAGFLLAKELRFLGEALDRPQRPFVAILGGAKISGKIEVIEALLPRVDRLLVGGAMANTFFRALGLETGASLVEEERIEMARDLLGRAGDRILLPVDCVVTEEISEGAPAREVARDDVGSGDRIVDIGATTRGVFAGEVASARTVVWNGPMGVFEVAPFDEGTVSVALAVAEACDGGALGVLGGGDSAAAAERAGVASRLTHVSTGGGASLELLAGSPLPGVESLSEGA